MNTVLAFLVIGLVIAISGYSICKAFGTNSKVNTVMSTIMYLWTIVICVTLILAALKIAP